MMRHGTINYYIEAEGFVTAHPLLNKQGHKVALQVLNDPQIADQERAFRFSRMFNLPQFRPPEEALVELGRVMEDTNDLHSDHSSVLAGYTYLGQFIDHDITFDPTSGLPSESLNPEEIINGRTPSLDLDSVYGRGPMLEVKPIYESDKIRLRIGSTTPSSFGDANMSLPNDLPRIGGEGTDRHKAVIADPRNDENLAVAQTHLAFLKAHNKLVELHAQEGLSGHQLFQAAKADLVRHYQWIVLYDFLPRICRRDVINDVLSNGRRFYLTLQSRDVTMPVEFSAAAFRLGHSMVRNEYEWNRVFNSGGFQVATLNLLFVFTGGSGNLGGFDTLPTNWIIDWRRFYDFSPVIHTDVNIKVNKIRKIDTSLALSLKKIPGFGPSDESNLAVRNLLRGRLLGLPTGQDVAIAMGVDPMSEIEILDGPHKNILSKYNLGKHTPLWYYILKEAEVQESGERLGIVGSTILAEVFSGLIENSRISILDGSNWKPTLPSRTPGEFEMADLLLFVNDINPLG